MKNSETAESLADPKALQSNQVLSLWSDAQRLAPAVTSWVKPRRGTLLAAAVGLTVTIGSTGLLMGALTTALASYLMSRGMEMVPAMNIGFFTVGSLSLVAGAATLVLAISRLKK